MDIQSFIESGLLEAYALGEVSREERETVERMLAAYPEARAELSAIENALEKMALSNAVAPPADLKLRVMDAVAKEPPPPAENGQVSLFRKVWLPWTLGVLACALLAYQTIAMENLRNSANALQQSLKECTEKDAKNAAAEQQIAFLRAPDTQIIPMRNAAGAVAKVYHNPAARRTEIDLSNLPASQKYLQCWAIVDGVPRSLGMVKKDDPNMWQALPYVEKAAAFAISEEDRPEGNPTPTTVLMIGQNG